MIQGMRGQVQDPKQSSQLHNCASNASRASLDSDAVIKYELRTTILQDVLVVQTVQMTITWGAKSAAVTHAREDGRDQGSHLGSKMGDGFRHVWAIQARV